MFKCVALVEREEAFCVPEKGRRLCKHVCLGAVVVASGARRVAVPPWARSRVPASPAACGGALSPEVVFPASSVRQVGLSAHSQGSPCVSQSIFWGEKRFKFLSGF